MRVLEDPADTNPARQVVSHPLRIVIAGSNGQVGQVLGRYFHARGHSVVGLVRTPTASSWRLAAWDGKSLERWVRELDGADALINLVGRSVNCRYNAANRREMLASRIESTRLLGDAVAQLSQPPRLWMNASTATIYRHALDREMDEATGEIGGRETDVPASWKFSIEVATRWEEVFFAASTPRTRKVALRSAMTMSPDRGGIFDTLLRLVRFGLGGAAGSGKQFVSWIHEEDFARVIEFLISHHEIEGAVNIASPNPLPNREFMAELRKAWGTRIGLPPTRRMLQAGAAFLRTETELILKSRRVVPGRMLAAGFPFHFSEWTAAAQDLVRRWKSARRAN